MSTIEERDLDEQIHENNPFLPKYSCLCGYLKGIENKGKICNQCGNICNVRPQEFRNYMGFINDPRLRGPRTLTRREQQFKNIFTDHLNSNTGAADVIRSSSFVSEHLDEIVDSTITNCRYLNERIIYPKMQDIDVTQTAKIVYNFVSYMVEEVYYPPYGAKARDTLFQKDIDIEIETIADLIIGALTSFILFFDSLENESSEESA